MSIAWIMPAVVGALMALYTALRIFDSRGAAEQWWGLGVGVVVGVLVVALVTVRLRHFLDAGKEQGLGMAIGGGFLAKLVGLAVIAAPIAMIRGREGLVEPDILTALIGYLACIFFGYALQAKLVEAHQRLQAQRKSEPGQTQVKE